MASEKHDLEKHLLLHGFYIKLDMASFLAPGLESQKGRDFVGSLAGKVMESASQVHEE